MIQASLGLNVAGFAAGAAAAEAAVTGIGGTATKAGSAIATAWSQVASAVYLANQVFSVLSGIVKTAAGGINMLAEQMIKSANAARALQNMAEESGLAIDRLAVLRGAFVRAGVGADEASQSITQMSKRLAQGAMFGTGEGVRAFSLLGINMRKMAETGDVLDNFTKIIEALKRVENSALRTSLATEIFGKSGARMLRLDTKKLEEAERIFKNQGKIIKEAAGFLSYLASVVDVTKEKISAFWMGFTSRVVPPWLDWIKKLENLDLAQWGISIGSFVADVFENFNKDRSKFVKFFEAFGIVIASAITMALKAALTTIISLLSDPAMWSAAFSIIQTAGNQFIQMAVELGVQAAAGGINLAVSMLKNALVEIILLPVTLFKAARNLLYDTLDLFWAGVDKLTFGLVTFLDKIFLSEEEFRRLNLSQSQKDLEDNLNKINEIFNSAIESQKTTADLIRQFDMGDFSEPKALPTVLKTVMSASSMAKVGGGGGFAGGAFDLGAVQLDESRRQTDIQRDQLRVLEDIRRRMNPYTEKDYSGSGADFNLP